MYATSLQKNISSYISFSQKPEIWGNFSDVPSLQYLKGRNFCDHKLLRNLFLRLRHDKKMYFAELIFAI